MALHLSALQIQLLSIQCSAATCDDCGTGSPRASQSHFSRSSGHNLAHLLGYPLSKRKVRFAVCACFTLLDPTWQHFLCHLSLIKELEAFHLFLVIFLFRNHENQSNSTQTQWFVSKDIQQAHATHFQCVCVCVCVYMHTKACLWGLGYKGHAGREKESCRRLIN